MILKNLTPRPWVLHPPLSIGMSYFRYLQSQSKKYKRVDVKVPRVPIKCAYREGGEDIG